ncbi:MAG TPA: PAAR-like domain-containing protein [Byssovorax sp.]|jgi:uncharacterized Zn-binding protein involved in type VI secretion
MFANTQGGGTDNAQPDVCKVPPPGPGPPVPTPFPNIGQGSSATGAAMKVLISGSPAHNLGTTTPVTQGDQGGTLGGMVSNRFSATRRHTVGVTSVLIGGKPATRLGAATSQNNNNAMGVRTTPSQRKVLITAG